LPGDPLGIPGKGQDVGEGLNAHCIRQTVGRQQQAISLAQFDGLDVHGYAWVGSEQPKRRTLGPVRCNLFATQAVQQLAKGVIHGQTPEISVAKEVDPRVTDVGDVPALRQ
jgi:hypothetical protein